MTFRYEPPGPSFTNVPGHRKPRPPQREKKKDGGSGPFYPGGPTTRPVIRRPMDRMPGQSPPFNPNPGRPVISGRPDGGKPNWGDLGGGGLLDILSGGDRNFLPRLLQSFGLY